MRRLSLDECNTLRGVAGATVALFLTDRCPVGCAHCSVSSRADSPTITDWSLFTDIVAGIAALPSLQAVAITGGEPFAERRGLTYAVDQLATAGVAVVLFTSGYWAHTTVAGWVGDILARTSTVYLSTDSFHATALAGLSRRGSGSRAALAVKAVTDAGAHLVLQVLDEPGAYDDARELCPDADISLISALPVGRGRTVFTEPPARPASSFGRCTLLNSPTVRYDGWVSACCNEAVISGAGPAALRRRATTPAGIGEALAAFRADPVLRLIGDHGPVALQCVADGPFQTVCQACWRSHERVATERKALAMVSLLSGAP
jgi:pyruvate-formate lyase-activating enzyme